MPLPTLPPSTADAASPTRVSRLLDEMGSRCEDIAGELDSLPRPRAKRVIALLQRLSHARELMRLRLLALRCGPQPRRSRVQRGVWHAWIGILSDSMELERVVRAAD